MYSLTNYHHSVAHGLAWQTPRPVPTLRNCPVPFEPFATVSDSNCHLNVLDNHQALPHCASQSTLDSAMRNSRERQPSRKQAQLDAEKERQAQKKSKPKPPPRNVQAATRKITTSRPAVAETPSLVRKIVVPGAANKGTSQIMRRSEDTVSHSHSSILTSRLPTAFEADHFRSGAASKHPIQARSVYCRHSSPRDEGGDTEDGISDEFGGLVPDDECYSSEPQSVPQSEIESEDENIVENEPSRLMVHDGDHHASKDTNKAQAHKRALSSSSVTFDEQPQKIQKTTQHSGDSRARRRDFDFAVQDTIKTTTDLLRLCLLTTNAFPTSTELEIWIQET
ncbi:hypothetical protein BDY19DRAFT_998322 [Irpex rosettiformis]|uniref:Uncharacterized protein n=1 Tax=Irpex rosettiformis TaxID=378272 RepID=A0ACB8TP59_9APHY|nr:hypothetical protein BDY19DRAFT_998322 [Irpex rosettiformis]